jgi:hypothetical protein
VPQATHAVPPLPHVLTSRPCTQTFPGPQQPLHERPAHEPDSQRLVVLSHACPSGQSAALLQPQ